MSADQENAKHKTRHQILNALRAHPFLSEPQLRWQLGLRKASSQNQLWQLQRLGWVRRYRWYA